VVDARRRTARVLLSRGRGRGGDRPRVGLDRTSRRPGRRLSGAFDGGPFERCSNGLPEWFDGNVDSAWLDATTGLAAFGTEDGRVFASVDEGRSWDEVASALPRIWCVMVAV
jgi:hypothetical protein